MEGPYRAPASTALAVRPVAARPLPKIRIGMIVGGVLLDVLATLAVSPVIAVVGGIIACAGFYGLLGYSWTNAHRRIDALHALPFTIVHDRPDAIAFDSVFKVKSLSITTRDPADVTPPTQPTTLRELVELLTTWGVAVHEKFGIVEVRVRWTRPSGPPPSL